MKARFPSLRKAYDHVNEVATRKFCQATFNCRFHIATPTFLGSHVFGTFL